MIGFLHGVGSRHAWHIVLGRALFWLAICVSLAAFGLKTRVRTRIYGIVELSLEETYSST